jgi:hypothetical protein
LVLAHREGAESIPKARIAVRPKLARSCLVQYCDGKGLKQSETERERERGKERDLLLASLQQGVSPSRSIQKAPETHGHILGKLLLVWCSTILTSVQESCPFMIARNVAGWW